jgi:hypothetical protein
VGRKFIVFKLLYNYRLSQVVLILLLSNDSRERVRGEKGQVGQLGFHTMREERAPTRAFQPRHRSISLTKQQHPSLLLISMKMLIEGIYGRSLLSMVGWVKL